MRRQYNPSLIIAILPDPAESQYRKIKRFGDITEGVATQCVVSITIVRIESCADLRRLPLPPEVEQQSQQECCF